MQPNLQACNRGSPHVRPAAAARGAAAQIHTDNREEAHERRTEDKSKADDAVIVGIGICAVLIINVCYIGYVTPPGGPSPPWADCYYSVYVAFLYLNGFALVFAIAAIVAVLVGPYVAVACKQPYWRKPVVQVGLLHVIISLLTLLGAFACAGFVLASMDVPKLSCAQLKCSQGGVTCSPFHLLYGSKNVSRYGISYTLLKSPPVYMLLDPRLARLNNDTLGEVDHGEIPGNAVTCRDYSYVASTALPGGNHSQFADLNLLDVLGHPINQTCFVLLSQAVFQNRSYKAETWETPGSESDMLAHWHSLRPNPFTLWCSSNQTKLGPGWLPLPSDMAYTLLNGTGSFQEPDLKTFMSSARISASNGSVKPVCPAEKGFERLANVSLTKQGDIMALQLFRDASNPWVFPDDQEIRSWARPHAVFHAPAVENSYTDFEDTYQHMQDKVLDYYATLGWEGKGAGFPCQSSNGYNYPWCQYHNFLRKQEGRPLSGAIPYAALRYQCSGADQGVLCDYSTSPPLAVDELGNYLTLKSLSAQHNYILYDETPTAAWVKWAVIAMLIVALMSNVGSMIFLAYPVFQGFNNAVVNSVGNLHADSHWRHG